MKAFYSLGVVEDRKMPAGRSLRRTKGASFGASFLNASPLNRYGSDISSIRFDELDQECMKYAIARVGSKQSSPVSAVDLGCGKATQAIRLAMCGYQAFAYDLTIDHQVNYSFLKSFPVGKLAAVEIDLRRAGASHLPRSIAIAYSQRFIHYLSWEDSVKLLTKLSKKMPSGGHLFISAAGIGTELGRNHPKRHHDRRDRLAELPPELQREHSIFEPLSVYSEDDVIALAQEGGFGYVNVWSSKFGNIKGVFAKT